MTQEFENEKSSAYICKSTLNFVLLSIQSSTVIIPYILQQSTLLLSEKYTSFGLQEVRTVYAGGYLGSAALRHHFSQIHTTHCCASWLLYCEERACGRVYRAQRNPTVIFYISNPTATASRRFYRPPVMGENITTLSNFKLVRSFPQKPYPPISFSHILQFLHDTHSKRSFLLNVDFR